MQQNMALPGFTPPPYATVPLTSTYTAFQWHSVTGSYGFPAEVDYNDPEYLRIFAECYQRELRRLEEQPLALVQACRQAPLQLQPPQPVYLVPLDASAPWPSFETNKEPATQTPAVRLKIKDDNLDLAAFGLASGTKPTDVDRIFYLIREVYRALNCRIPVFDERPTPIMSLVTAPVTQNIEKQLRNMRQLLYGYTKDLRASVQQNKFFDLAMHSECVRNLNILDMMQEELRTYENLNMDYEQGKFRWKEGEEKATNLEWLLGRMVQQIRDCYLLVNLFDWAKKKNKDGLNNLNGMYEQGKVFDLRGNAADPEQHGGDGGGPPPLSPQPNIHEANGRLCRGPGQ